MAKLTYWQKRYLQIAQLRHKNDAEYIKQMQSEYDRLSKNVMSEISDWVSRYAENDSISEDEAHKMLSKQEQKSWSMSLEEFRQKAIDGGYDQELNREYYKSRISRLEQLQRQLYFELAEMANNQESNMSSYLKEQLNETYLRQIYELTDRGPFSLAFSKYSSRELDVALRKPWAGSNFSKRVWKNHLKVIPDKLSKVMAQSIVNGWGVDKTVKAMMTGFDSDLKNRMTTLVQTESAHLAEVANDKSMAETGVERWKWLSTLEVHTCEVCGGLDGQTFAIDDKSAPICPRHPNCRCTKVPVIASWEDATRWQRDPVTGKGSLVESQSFEDWKKDKVTPGVEKQLKINRAKATDKRQYERYQSLLGKGNVPKSLADFTEMKYNNSEQWSKLNGVYRDKSLQNKIQSEYNLTIHEGQQGKHILGHNNYKDGKSYLLDIVNPQELVTKYAGTGEIQRRRGKWTNKELIIQDEFIGVNSSFDGSLPFTNRFFIHYSKKGTHIVPTLKGVSDDES